MRATPNEAKEEETGAENANKKDVEQQQQGQQQQQEPFQPLRRRCANANS